MSDARRALAAWPCEWFSTSMLRVAEHSRRTTARDPEKA
jgi:hypothetical protein